MPFLLQGTAFFVYLCRNYSFSLCIRQIRNILHLTDLQFLFETDYEEDKNERRVKK